MKTMTKLGLAVILFMATAVFNSAMAQDKYGFAISDQKYSDKERIYYYFISDPVKNWDEMSEQEKNDFNIEFKMSAKKQTGEELVTEYRVGFYQGTDRYNSLAEAKQAIEKRIETIEESQTRTSIPIKFIRINLYKYR